MSNTKNTSFIDPCGFRVIAENFPNKVPMYKIDTFNEGDKVGEHVVSEQGEYIIAENDDGFPVTRPIRIIIDEYPFVVDIFGYFYIRSEDTAECRLIEHYELTGIRYDVTTDWIFFRFGCFNDDGLYKRGIQFKVPFKSVSTKNILEMVNFVSERVDIRFGSKT